MPNTTPAGGFHNTCANREKTDTPLHYNTLRQIGPKFLQPLFAPPEQVYFALRARGKAPQITTQLPKNAPARPLAPPHPNRPQQPRRLTAAQATIRAASTASHHKKRGESYGLHIVQTISNIVNKARYNPSWKLRPPGGSDLPSRLPAN
jgi:hypothetical protein